MPSVTHSYIPHLNMLMHKERIVTEWQSGKHPDIVTDRAQPIMPA